MRTSRSLNPKGAAIANRLESHTVLVTGSTESPSTVTSTDLAEMSGLLAPPPDGRGDVAHHVDVAVTGAGRVHHLASGSKSSTSRIQQHQRREVG